MYRVRYKIKIFRLTAKSCCRYQNVGNMCKSSNRFIRLHLDSKKYDYT